MTRHGLIMDGWQYYISVPRVINDNRGGVALLLAATEWELRNAK